jgi:hypothetical protein
MIAAVEPASWPERSVVRIAFIVAGVPGPRADEA